MNLAFTSQALERYEEKAPFRRGDLRSERERLRQVSRKELIFVQWQGKPAVFFDRTYWRYERDAATGDVTLTVCLGIFKPL